jgi:FeS assembly SUF system regulator
MMRLSRLADFAIVLMTHMAQSPGATHSAAEMAAATRLPGPTVAKVLARLCHEGLIGSARGVKGGYRLERPAAAISVDSIVSAVDGPVALTQCITPKDGSHPVSRCEVETLCRSRVGLHAINRAVRKALEEVSLADIAMAGLPRSTPAASVTAGKADHNRELS